MSDTLDLDTFINPDNRASQIADKWSVWDSMRAVWMDRKKEVQEYIFATDTTTTTNKTLPWKNKIHIPKLCHIRDNLHANYMATLFPSDNAIVWEGDDTNSETREKRQTIQSYMRNKLKQSHFRSTVSTLLLDYIDCGNVFAMPVFEADYSDDLGSGQKVAKYIGPRLQRIDPTDIVFDPTASSFENTPKIVRSLVTLGTLKRQIDTKPELKYREEVFAKMMDLRSRFAPLSHGDFGKQEQFSYDGFASFWEYFNSDCVEILDFYGDYYDKGEGKLYRNHLISVVDRAYIIRDEPLDNWLGTAPIRHAGWRTRQNNLYAMGPLDNLVGIQHRIDHLENSKADLWDQYNWPMPKITGDVADFEFGPGERIYTGDEGDVEFLRPDPTFLQADPQIEMYERKMEEMAGSPKEAVGFRTPGEKTKYEVQVLENGANKVFINKVSHFEETFLEPVLNDMLEQARRNLNEADTIRVVDNATQAVTFTKITRDDIIASGKIRPIGARHFAQNANILQNLTEFANGPLGQNPNITAHISGKRMALAMESLLGIEKYRLVQENIGLMEQAELQQIAGSLQQALLEQQTAGMTPEQAAQATAQAQTPEGNPSDGQNQPPTG